MRNTFALGAFLPLLASCAVGDSRNASACLSGLAPALVAGGFSGSTDCQSDRLTIAKVGSIQQFGRSYTIYDYHYRLQPACPECAVHGGQRIIVMEGGRYIGQYKPDFALVTIQHDNLVLSPKEGNAFGPPVTIGFTQGGPQGEIWFGGASQPFFR